MSIRYNAQKTPSLALTLKVKVCYNEMWFSYHINIDQLKHFIVSAPSQKSELVLLIPFKKWNQWIWKYIEHLISKFKHSKCFLLQVSFTQSHIHSMLWSTAKYVYLSFKYTSGVTRGSVSGPEILWHMDRRDRGLIDRWPTLRLLGT